MRINLIKKPLIFPVLFFRAVRTKVYTICKYKKRCPKIREVIYIDPNKIVGHLTKARWQKLRRRTGLKGNVILDGNWDSELIGYLEFKEMDIYKSLHMRWVEGKSWEQTWIYQTYKEQINNSEKCPFSNLNQLEYRYRELDRIFHKIQNDGNLSNEYRHLVRINIDRGGRLIWGPGGRHRMSIAIILGLHKVPAKIGFVHPNALDVLDECRIPSPKDSAETSLFRGHFPSKK